MYNIKNNDNMWISKYYNILVLYNVIKNTP